MRWTDYALKKTGARTLAEFQRSYGLPETGEADLVTSRALWDYLVGYRCHRMGPRETLYQVAQTYNTTIQAIWAGNCGLPADRYRDRSSGSRCPVRWWTGTRPMRARWRRYFWRDCTPAAGG